MPGQTKGILSEHTKDMAPEQREGLQEEVGKMAEGELKRYRNSLGPDNMGFFGEESVWYGSAKD